MASDLLPSRWVTVDPGETTGYAVFEGDVLVHAGQAELWQFVWAFGWDLSLEEVQRADSLLAETLDGWQHAVFEDWHLYRDKALSLVGDKQDTVRGLGALQYTATVLGRTYDLQPATIKDPARAAGATDLFLTPIHPNRHANDAITHGVHWAAMRGKGIVQAG